MSIFTFKQSTSNPLAFPVIDTVTGLGVTGLLYTDFSCKVAKNAGALATKTLAPADFVEAGDGWYWIKLAAGECDTLGPGFLEVTTGTQKAAYPFQIVANTEADTMARLGAPAGASIAADIAAVLAATGGGGGALETTAQAILARTDVATSSRLATASYVAPDNAGIAHALNAALGLFVVIGAPTYNASTPDLATVRVRLYDNQAHAVADDGATGLVVEFTKTITYSATAISGTAHQIQKVSGS